MKRMTLSIPLIIILVVRLNLSAPVRFKINSISDGSTSNEIIEKIGFNNKGENTFTTSTKDLIVVGGISGTEFTNVHFSRLISYHFQKRYLEWRKHVRFFTFEDRANPKLKWGISDSKGDYREIVRPILDGFPQLEGNTLMAKLKSEISDPAITLASVSLIMNGEVEEYILTGIGDSRVMIFTLAEEKKKQKDSKFYYLPSFISPEEYVNFTTPQQIGVEDKGNLNFRSYSHNSYPGMIFLLGTDGFYSNFHFGLLTMMINALFVLSSEFNLASKKADVEAFLQKLVDIYLEVINKKEGLINAYYGEGKDLEEKAWWSKKAVINFTSDMSYLARNFATKCSEKMFGEIDKYLKEHETTQPSHNSEKKVFQAFFKYFRIHGADMVAYSIGESSTVPSSISSILKDDFNLDASSRDKALSNFDPKTASEILVKFANQFSKLKNNYPSNFIIRAWKSPLKGKITHCGGREDDITAVIGLTEESPWKETKTIEQTLEEFEQTKTNWKSDLEEEAKYFAKTFWLTKSKQKKITIPEVDAYFNRLEIKMPSGPHGTLHHLLDESEDPLFIPSHHDHSGNGRALLRSLDVI